jgi:16S rRNA (cytosine1402-N4)-methyltransferase
MLAEAIGLLPRGGADRTYVDCTFGGGEYARALLQRDPRARIVAIDADVAAWQSARELADAHPGRIIPVHANFSELDQALDAAGIAEVDGVLYDLGLSSLQLADPRRGFALDGDAPLDMRLDLNRPATTAADLLAALGESELADLIFFNADERNARRIARNIVTRRQRSPLKRTGDLVAAVLSALPSGRGRRHSRIHPATRTFQALRMAVNDELGSLQRSLDAAVPRLKPGGRVLVVSFHSGEDRIVKRTFAAWRAAGTAKVLTPKPLRPQRSEVLANPRSRSAKLRAAEKIADVAHPVPQEAA